MSNDSESIPNNALPILKDARRLLRRASESLSKGKHEEAKEMMERAQAKRREWWRLYLSRRGEGRTIFSGPLA
jgi:hypothetical protein